MDGVAGRLEAGAVGSLGGGRLREAERDWKSALCLTRRPCAGRWPRGSVGAVRAKDVGEGTSPRLVLDPWPLRIAMIRFDDFLLAGKGDNHTLFGDGIRDLLRPGPGLHPRSPELAATIARHDLAPFR